jgi:transposase
VWNLALEQANHWRRGGSATPNAAERQRQLAEARGCSWLGDGSSSVQQQALRDFDQALRNWWGGSHRRPRWRRRGISEGFVVRDVKVRVLSRKWATLNVPKLGAVRFRLSRPMPAEHGMARVTLDAAGRWHVSFSAPQPSVDRAPTGRSVGIDLGVVATIATSDGERRSAPSLGAAESRRLRMLQRKMARQRKGSNQRARTKHAIAVLRARETDRRKDWTEWTSTQLVRRYDLVVFEGLKVRNMMRSASGTIEKPGRNVAQKRGLNRSIAAQGWARLVLRTEQKAAASSVECIKVSAAYSSRTCAECGVVDGASRRSQSAFRCVACGHAENADVNAARVVHARGLRVSARGGPPEVGAPVEARTALDVAA